ncbi:MAG: hypothetical protein MJZ56_01175 [Bacteroidales bacterium]|nr:hypothetical protein [Bacteroidales bacterium]
MKFYDVDDIFTFGKYENDTLAEVYEKDPKYIKYCQDNIDDFYISPSVLKELKNIKKMSNDNKLLNTNLDEMSDDEIADFLKEMNETEDFDPSQFEDFEYDEENDTYGEELNEDELFGEEDEDDEDFLDEFSDSYDERY